MHNIATTKTPREYLFMTPSFRRSSFIPCGDTRQQLPTLAAKPTPRPLRPNETKTYPAGFGVAFAHQAETARITIPKMRRCSSLHARLPASRLRIIAWSRSLRQRPSGHYWQIHLISDITPIPHKNCRTSPRMPQRISDSTRMTCSIEKWSASEPTPRRKSANPRSCVPESTPPAKASAVSSSLLWIGALSSTDRSCPLLVAAGYRSFEGGKYIG